MKEIELPSKRILEIYNELVFKHEVTDAVKGMIRATALYLDEQHTKPAELPEVKKECEHKWGLDEGLNIVCGLCGKISDKEIATSGYMTETPNSKADQTVDISDLISLEVTTELGQDGKQRFLTEESARAILNLLKSKGE